MPFDRRRMHFYKGVVLTQAQWDQIQRERPKMKMGSLMAVMAGLAIGATMSQPQPQRRPPTCLEDLA